MQDSKITRDLAKLVPYSQRELNKSKTKPFYSAKELLDRKATKMPCLIDPIIPKVGLCCLAGSSDTGKSSFLRQLGTSIVLGESHFLGFKVNASHNKVIYVSTEDDDYAISYLLNKSFAPKGISSDYIEGLKYLFDTIDLLSRLRAILENEPHDLIIIDAFSDLYGNSMNDSNQVRIFLHQYNLLAHEFKCAIIFLHHTGKHTEDKMPSKNNLLGSQGFEAKMRLVIELRNDPLDPTKRHMCIVKGNYLPSSYKNESYVLEFKDEMEFDSTGNRVPFEMLGGNTKIDRVEEVKRLKKEGNTQLEISEKTGIPQPTVSRYLKR